jgi:DNA-binding transcriptional MerR regulator
MERGQQCINIQWVKHVRRWRNDRAFLCKANGNGFRGPKERRYTDEDVAVLHVVRETRAKGMPVTRQAVQVKATQTARSRQ